MTPPIVVTRSRLTIKDVALALVEKGGLRPTARRVAHVSGVGRDVAWRWLTGQPVHRSRDLKIRKALGLPLDVPFLPVEP